MSEMVERVAKVLFAENDDAAYFGMPFDLLSPGMKEHWEKLARKAIATMRDPTDEMIYAADLLCKEIDGVSVPAIPELAWEAMVDESLK